MQNLAFRILIVVALLASIGISGFYRRRANRMDRKVSMEQEGKFAVGLIRLLMLAHLSGLAAYLIHPQWMDWARLPLPQAARWAGLAGMYLNVPFIWWLFRNLGKNVTPTVEVRRQASLVTSGPYRWIRHPLYTAGAFGLFCLALAASSAYFLTSALLALVFMAWRTPREEARLIERFGDDYRQYMQRTGRFLPRVLGDFAQSSKERNQESGIRKRNPESDFKPTTDN